MASVSARDVTTRWVSLINGKERYYYTKAMDLFYSLELDDQRSLLRFFVEETKTSKWEAKLDDSTQYASVIRAILFYYSGNPELKGEPTKEDFRTLLGKWIRAHEKAKKTVIRKRSFIKELEAI